ncbi:MAG: hypothetical protein U1E06_25075, partial [Tabrizicola sp.]|nr:hypothetical protein [Tabrizicola sp.]
TEHEAFSSAEGIGLPNLEAQIEQEKIMGKRRRGAAGFITMDEPEHSQGRKAVSPTLAPSNLHAMSPQVRERAGQILDSLPIGKEFDWVDLVSKELTAMTLATLFDFPFEQRRKLTWWWICSRICRATGRWRAGSTRARRSSSALGPSRNCGTSGSMLSRAMT